MNKFNQIAAFGKELVKVENIEDSLELISKEAKTIVHADRCSIFIVDVAENILWTKLSDGIGGRIVISLDSGIVGDTYTKKEAQVVNNPYEDPRFLPSIDKKSGYKTKNIITIPIFNSKREIMGIMQLLNKSRFDFDENDLEVLTFFANYISGTLELVLLSEK
ncbi:GAF domain-containing protein [Sulfurimonas sp. C5]|uniref:GAF domain-containing protein n=1 Tax=Sulfurimonas sp. C5 TaxID=3036947 RepID=UPI002454DE10|nr:GAF domain-containing protein [Sulfurimonas sp. C5]MDH4944317.1 GAF domain-containing protein [Sulfurimonas sp. C5]